MLTRFALLAVLLSAPAYGHIYTMTGDCTSATYLGSGGLVKPCGEVTGRLVIDDLYKPGATVNALGELEFFLSLDIDSPSDHFGFASGGSTDFPGFFVMPEGSGHANFRLDTHATSFRSVGLGFSLSGTEAGPYHYVTYHVVDAVWTRLVPPASAISEPGTLSLIAVGLIGLLFRLRNVVPLPAARD